MRGRLKEQPLASRCRALTPFPARGTARTPSSWGLRSVVLIRNCEVGDGPLGCGILSIVRYAASSSGPRGW